MEKFSNKDLPKEGHVRWPTISRMTGLARSTVWRMEQRNAFPKSIRLTPRLTIWKSDQIRAWLDDPVSWARSAAESKA